MWVSVKAVYSELIHDRDDWEIAKTFFNFLPRRIFDTVGVNCPSKNLANLLPSLVMERGRR